MSFTDQIAAKILMPPDAAKRVEHWRSNANASIVFTNGCFDILHRGHLEYLAKAADLGTHLIIGLNSDASVKRLKGQERPLNKEDDRAFALASLSFTNLVVVFDEDTPANLIELLKPEILVKGGDYVVESIVGYTETTARGGRVVTIPFFEGYSTTSLIEKIKA
ncbi:MAG: D-glycero-beta-D-manno-heptose 1-phosphate adenylyltransferase [Bacteroidia bacterium]|jgi:rfaE bifunctional protein nucleotidyltransferase chain/domain